MGSCWSSYQKYKMKREAKRWRKELRKIRTEMKKSIRNMDNNKRMAMAEITNIKQECKLQTLDEQLTMERLKPHTQLLATNARQETLVKTAIAQIQILETNIESVYVMGLMTTAFQDAFKSLTVLKQHLNLPNVSRILQDLSRETDKLQQMSEMIQDPELTHDILFPSSQADEIQQEAQQIAQMHTDDVQLDFDMEHDNSIDVQTLSFRPITWFTDTKHQDYEQIQGTSCPL